MPEVLWYYVRNDQQFGPVSAAELKQLADAGRLSPDDLLWREGMGSWSTAVNLQGLFADAESGASPTTSAPTTSAPGAATATASTATSAPAAARNNPLLQVATAARNSPLPQVTAATTPVPSGSGLPSGSGSQPVLLPPRRVSLRSLLRGMQLALWIMCVFVVLMGIVIFTRSFLLDHDPAMETSAAAEIAMFFIGAYVLARSGEKLSRLLTDHNRRRR